MASRVFATSGVTSRGPALTDANFVVGSAARDRVVSGSSSGTVQHDDRSYTSYTGATVDHEHDLQLTETVLGSLAGVTITNLTPEVATIDSDFKLTRVASGTASFLVRTPLLTRRISLAISRSAGTTGETLIGFVAGCLAKHCSDAIDALISGVTASNTTKAVYSATNIRNAACWAHTLDLTPLSTSFWGGTLISPRHAVVANHAGTWTTGTSMSWVAADNTVVTRTLAANGVRVGSTDLMIVKLSSDLPGSINFARALPANYASYLPTLGIPVVCLDQDPHATLALWNGAGSQVTEASYLPPGGARAAFFEAKIAGDSGKPAFAFINGVPVLLSCWHTGSGGPLLSNFITEVNAVMTSLGGGYSLTQADLSGFTSF